MSKSRASGRPKAKPAPTKARQTPLASARAQPEKNSSLLKSTAPRRKPPNAGNAMGITRKGIPNKVTSSAREMFIAFYQNKMPEAELIWDRVKRRNPAMALRLLLKGADHFLPKLQRTEFTGDMHHSGELQHRHRVRKPWPYPDGLGSDPIEMSRRYTLMMSGEYELPDNKDMQRVSAAATYRSMMHGESQPADIAAFVAENSRPPPEQQPLPPPPRPTVEVLLASGTMPKASVPHDVQPRDVEDAELLTAQQAAEDAELRGSDYGRPKVVT